MIARRARGGLGDSATVWSLLGAVAMFSMFAFFLLMPIHLKRRIEMLKLETSE